MIGVLTEACKWSALARERLERIDVIMCAVEGLSAPTWREKMRLRDMMEELKAALVEDTGPPGSVPDDADESEFRRTAREALTALEPASNADPLKSGWYNALYSARVEVEYYLWKREHAEVLA